MTPTYGTGSPPSFTGGTIAQGTYNATGLVLYGDCGQVEMIEILTVDFSGGASGTLQAVLGFQGQTEPVTYTYSTSGSMLTIAPTCGQSAQSTSSYTATSNSVLIESTNTAQDGGICTGVWTLTM